MKKVVIISGVRTPVGRYMGALKEIPAYDLGALVLNEAVKRAGVDPAHVDEVILGQSYQSRYGLECICGGGGLSIAGIFERL